MNRDTARLGPKVRAVRRERGLTQVELARRLEISPSYLNLIEHGQRSLTAALLLRLAKELGLDLEAFTPESDQQLVGDLSEVLSDPIFEGHDVSPREIAELVERSPNLARSMLTLFRGFEQARASADSLASQIYANQQVAGLVQRSPMASEEVSDFIQTHRNYFPELEAEAERLWAEAELQRHDVFGGLLRHLERDLGVRVKPAALHRSDGALRRFDPQSKTLLLSNTLALSSRTFGMAAQIGLLRLPDLLDELADDPGLTSPEARSLCRMVLANYFAGAVVMPYMALLEAAREERYDIEVLGHRFGASFEQVCHRLTSLRKEGTEGVPFHMIRVDLAGNISKRFSASGIRFARFAGACPRWNVFSAFLTPGAVRIQISVMPDGEAYFCVARTVPKGRGGHRTPHTVQAIGLGCRIEHARALVYSDGFDLDRLQGAVPIGVTCRLCERPDCEQRAFPSIREPLTVDENVRGPSFYWRASPRNTPEDRE